MIISMATKLPETLGSPKMSTLSTYVVDLLSKQPTFPSIQALLHRHPTIEERLRTFSQDRPIRQNQRSVRFQRYQIPRPGHSHVPKTLYYNFLRELYPLPGDTVHHNQLFNAYSRLPTPQPLHVSPRHFEDLLDRFSTIEGKHGRKASVNAFSGLVQTMRKCGIPISMKEVNSFVYLKNYNEKNIIKIKREWYTMREMMTDVSTANIFLKFAVRADNYGFVKEIMDWMKENDVRMDRVSYDLVLKYVGANVGMEDSISLVQGIMREGIVVDISFINTLMETIVNSGDIRGAHMVLEEILRIAAEPYQLKSATSRRQHLQLMMMLDSMKLQCDDSLLFAMAPTFDTFRPLLTYYSSMTTFNPSKITYLLKMMLNSKLQPTPKHLRAVLQTFRENDASITEQLKLIGILLKNDSVNIDHELYNEIMATCQKQERFQSVDVNEMESMWREEYNWPAWKRKRDGSDLKELASHSVERLITAL